MKSPLEQAFSDTAKELLVSEPFYSHLLGYMNRSYSEAIPTAGVRLGKDCLVELCINPKFFMENCDSQQRVGLLKHEILHVVLGHLIKQKEKDYHPTLHNISADLVVNQYVSPWPLPGDHITLDTFPHLELQPHRSLDYYYEKILGLYQELMRMENSQGQSCQGQSCGEGSAETKISKGEARKNKEAKQSVDALKSILNNDSSFHPNHQWEEEQIKELSETEITILQEALEEFIAKIKKQHPEFGFGKLPGNSRRDMGKITKARKQSVNWKNALKIFSQKSGSSKLGWTKKRRSKRYGTIPGTKILRCRKMVVAIDTSGSIGHELLSQFFMEISSIYKMGTRITVIECDAAVQQSYQYTGKMNSDVKGFGGTAFDPVFEFINKGPKVDGCIYLTDGYGPTPTIIPRCKVLWVISPDGNDKALKKSHGSIVFMKENSNPVE